MQRTLQELLVQCLQEGRSEQSGINPSKYPSQLLCLAEQVLFTERCEQAVLSDSLSEFAIELEAQLDSYTNSDIQVPVKFVRSENITKVHGLLVYQLLATICQRI